MGRVTPPSGLITVGPLVQVEFAPVEAALPSLADKIPSSLEAAVMVDTGAEATCVDGDIPQALGLSPIRHDPIVGVSGVVVHHPVYRMRMHMTIGNRSKRVQHTYTANLIGVPASSNERFNGLIGRDFLAGFRLALTN